jgi:hypothetical protein
MRPKKRKARKTLVKAIRVEPDINRRMLLAGFGEDAPPLLYLTAGYLDSPFLEKLLPPDQWVPIVQTHVDGLAKEFIRVLQRRDYKTLLRVAHMLKKGASPEPVDRWRASISTSTSDRTSVFSSSLATSRAGR